MRVSLLPKPQHLSAAGAAFIGRYEGWRPQPYNDPVGYATIGYGHLLHRSPVRPDDIAKWGTLTPAQGLKLLQQDAELAAASIRNHVKVRITQAQFDALVSFAFNVGVGGFEQSTLLRKLNAGDKTGAADELLKWDMAGGHHLPGLLARRRDERHLFLVGYTIVQKPSQKVLAARRKALARARLIAARLHVTKLARQRAMVVAFAHWGIAHADKIHWAEVRPIPRVTPGKLPALPFTTDCSGFVTMAHQYAGLPDPNNNGYNGQGWTETLLDHNKHIPLALVKPADDIVYGARPGAHTAIILRGGKDPITASHGREAGPEYVKVSQDGRLPQTYLQLAA